MVQLLERALLDTVIGMGVVFAMLILISLIIWSFKYIGVFEKRMENKKSAEIITPIPVPSSITQIEEEEEVEEELADDLELAAVITAAIYASMGEKAPVNGLVVKSIKKANRAAWLKA